MKRYKNSWYRNNKDILSKVEYLEYLCIKYGRYISTADQDIMWYYIKVPKFPKIISSSDIDMSITLESEYQKMLRREKLERIVAHNK